jgi:NAD(P)-dependent dehydrogenase (short-subunit alcohol dehydrogenase family)
VISPEIQSVKNQFDLKGKTAIITGGGGFLGLHFALALGQMGAYPILFDINEESLRTASISLKEEGIDCETHSIDICDGAQVEALMKRIDDSISRIDILVNSAAFAMKNLQEGGEAFFEAFEDYPEELWKISIEGNLNGIFNITKAVGATMKRQRSGAIINIASDVAIISPDHRIYEPDPSRNYLGVNFNTPAAYSVSKAGILSLTRYLATHWARYGIRVNSISPAGVYKEQDEKFVEQLTQRIPLGRMARPEELMGPVVFLSSNSSSFMTGANLVVDGGRTIW